MITRDKIAIAVFLILFSLLPIIAGTVMIVSAQEQVLPPTPMLQLSFEPVPTPTPTLPEFCDGKEWFDNFMSFVTNPASFAPDDPFYVSFVSNQGYNDSIPECFSPVAGEIGDAMGYADNLRTSTIYLQSELSKRPENAQLTRDIANGYYSLLVRAMATATYVQGWGSALALLYGWNTAPQ